MSTIVMDTKGPLLEEKLAMVEQMLGVKFPQDYRNFMLKNNGGRTDPDGFDIVWQANQEIAEDWRTSTLSWFFSIWDNRAENLIRINTVTFRGRIPMGTVAIGRDAGGNLILLVVDGPLAGRILFWVKDHEVEEGQVPGFDNVGFLANSFDEFLNSKLR